MDFELERDRLNALMDCCGSGNTFVPSFCDVDTFILYIDAIVFVMIAILGYACGFALAREPVGYRESRIYEVGMDEFLWFLQVVPCRVSSFKSCKVRVGSNGNLLWEASVLLGGVRVAREDDRGVTEGREDVREVFQQRRSGAKRKLSRCGRNQLGNEPILALPEGADDFVVYYDARSKDLEACLEKGRRRDVRTLAIEEAYMTKYSIHPRADTVTILWAITGESKLNGSNLVHETTNKIAVIQERLEVVELSKELPW
ncbi:hypothetical protein Tco_0708072 [Tanacetum coccineum]